MQKWEYMLKENKDLSQGDFSDLCYFFNNWNNKGWKLVKIARDNSIAYFKRPVDEAVFNRATKGWRTDKDV